MKKMILAVAALVAVSGGANAAATITADVYAQIDSTLSIAITSNTAYDFGVVSAGSTVIQGSGFVIQNNGGGQDETLSLSAAVLGADWTLLQVGGPTGANQVALDAMFNAAIPAASTDFTQATDRLTNTPVAANASNFAGDQTGLSVPHLASRTLWTLLSAPASSSVATKQQMVITITASNP